jgi:hypothetical protein
LEALMRPHGRAEISARSPRALGVCERCGFLYNLDRLAWQHDWQQGPRLKNLHHLVCPDCYDEPQESGRTIVLPPDPIPVQNARPEDYVGADNPLSPLGYNVRNAFNPLPAQSLGGNIGTMTLNGGVNAAFDGNPYKRAPQSAALSVSLSSFQNWVGKNWNADPSGTSLTITSTVARLTHIVASFSIYAPSDARFLNSGATGFTLDGSVDSLNWTTIYSSTTTGTVGELITATTTSAAAYPYHRIAIQGDGISTVTIAQAVFNVADAAPNDI